MSRMKKDIHLLSSIGNTFINIELHPVCVTFYVNMTKKGMAIIKHWLVTHSDILFNLFIFCRHSINQTIYVPDKIAYLF